VHAAVCDGRVLDAARLRALDAGAPIQTRPSGAFLGSSPRRSAANTSAAIKMSPTTTAIHSNSLGYLLGGLADRGAATGSSWASKLDGAEAKSSGSAPRAARTGPLLDAIDCRTIGGAGIEGGTAPATYEGSTTCCGASGAGICGIAASSASISAS